MLDIPHEALDYFSIVVAAVPLTLPIRDKELEKCVRSAVNTGWKYKLPENYAICRIRDFLYVETMS